MRSEIIHPDEAQPLLVFGGPYSNLQATHAMFQVAQGLNLPIQNIICTGDVVAYAADPEATSQFVRTWGVRVVAGNCEEQLATGAEDCGCGFDEGSACDILSRGWYPYALSHVTDQTRAWMAGLAGAMTFTYAGLDFRVVHGGVRQTNEFLFASEVDALAGELKAANELAPCDVLIGGHAGIPFVRRIGERLWLNAGVIGMPANDGTRDGWYALVTPDRGGLSIALRRLAYDAPAAAAAMRRAGHANGYARTMVSGIWPSHDVLPPAELEATGRKLRQRTQRFAMHKTTGHNRNRTTAIS